MLFLNFDLKSITTGLVPGIAAVLFYLAFALAVAPSVFKSALLSFNQDGREILGAGFGVAIIGLLVPDFAYAHDLVMIGVGLMAFGGLIWLEDHITNKVLHPVLGLVYLVVALVAYLYGTYARGLLAFNTRAFVWLCVPVFVASVATVISAMTTMSESFKSRVLPMDSAGLVVMVFGLLAFIAGPFASLNPTVMIATSAVGGLLTSFGGLVALPISATEWLLQKKSLFLTIPLIIGYIALSRVGF